MKTNGFTTAIMLSMMLSGISPAYVQVTNEPVISKSVFSGRSIPLRETKVVLPGIHPQEQKPFMNRFPYGTEKMKAQAQPPDSPLLQKSQGTLSCRGPILNFEGVGNLNGIRPADPNGEVGPNHYLQTVNSSFAVWDKEGNLLFGPADNKTIWESLPGPWHDLFWGDPVFKYDPMADRWVVSSLSVGWTAEDPHYTMVAVSVTPDPLGEYYCYAFEFDLFNDYQKIAVWSDGYYITYNMYDAADPSPEAYLYSLVTVINREAMLSGEEDITMIEFVIPDPDTERFFPMAADMRGQNIVEDEPCYIITLDNHVPGEPWYLSLDVYEFQTDWEEPENSQFNIVYQYDLGSFEPMILWGPGAPQKGSDINLITMPLYLMYPGTYRQIADHASLVCCHSVWDGNLHYIKWYELRKEQADWYLYQTGNYAPDDFHYFSPSLSINGNGDIALGYTVSSEDTYPSIKLTGRRAEDPTGIMTFQQLDLYNGLNYANTYLSWYDQNMWGDYAAMMVDPVDDTTFWFTHMYTKATTALGNWATRIFKIDLSGAPDLPHADAGNDTLTCNLPFYTTQGHAENYSSILWTTSGDGYFIENHSVNAIYLRGPADLDSHQVTLTMHLTGYEPGTTASDSMILYINKEPEAYAGMDDTIYGGEVIALQGTVNFAYEYYWSTLGDGVFTDSTLLDAIYTPGQQDMENRGVTLVLTAREVSPCTGSVSDSLTVDILFVVVKEIPEEKCHLILFPNPARDIITLQAEVQVNEKVILQVLDSQGKIIFMERVISGNGSLEKQFDLTYLNPGIYFFRLQAGNIKATQKLLLLR